MSSPFFCGFPIHRVCLSALLTVADPLALSPVFPRGCRNRLTCTHRNGVTVAYAKKKEIQLAGRHRTLDE